MSSRQVFLAGMMPLLLSGVLWGHTVVYPEHVLPGSFEKFVVRVPTEKPIPTTQVRLLIPEGLQVFSLGGKEGWRYALEKDSAGRVKSITWGGGAIPAGEFADFEFVARAPKTSGNLVWKAYQTYRDGSVVAWVGPPDSSEPASITEVKASRSPGSAPVWVSWTALAVALAAALLSGYTSWRHA